MNRRLRKANEEIEHLAKVAERERIAREDRANKRMAVNM